MKYKLARTFVAVLLLASAVAECADPHATTAPIRIWGHGHRGQDYILTLLRAWETAYRAQHPEATFDNQLTGNASAMGGLWTGSADLALMDREASFIEEDGYEQGTGHKPFGVAVARGSVSTPHHAPALVLYVNPANPLAGLSMEQVDALFDADHRLAPARIRRWGDLGLSGAWSDKAITLYSLPILSNTLQAFERNAMKGSQKFSCCLHTRTTAAELTAALQADRFGIALSDAVLPGMKALALSAGQHDAVTPAAASIISGSYPLGRSIFLYCNRKPNEPLPPQVADFMRFIVSDQGQAIALHTGGYLPLSPEAAALAREALQ